MACMNFDAALKYSFLLYEIHMKYAVQFYKKYGKNNSTKFVICYSCELKVFLSFSTGNTKSVIYKKIKQTASDDESSEENTVLDKDDKNAVLLQIIPSTTAKQRRSKEEFDENRRGNTCRPWLLILVFVVALSILTVGILFARQLQSKDNKNPPNNKFVPSGDPLDADKMNLKVQDTRKWNRIWKDMCMLVKI